MEVTVRTIPVEEVRPIRHAILRPGRPAVDAEWDGDDLPATLHFGAFAGDTLIGIASLYLRPPPGDELPDAWQLRGMATLEEYRGQGIGSRLVDACLEYIRNEGGRWVWCNARTPAVSLYERHGFQCVGDEFEMPRIGPHYRMVKKL